MKFKKTTLSAYKDISPIYHALNSDVASVYELTVKTVWLGIIATEKKIEYEILRYQNEKATLKQWDRLIRTQQEIN